MSEPTRWREARGLLLVACATTILGCDDPAQTTDLRPSGPPEVLAVLVGTDPSYQLNESATYCAPNDPKRPSDVGLPDFTLSQVCDADISVEASMVDNAYPDGWYVRVMFDELLDPDVEELIEILDGDGNPTDTYYGTIANTQPVTLRCESINGGMIDVPYDGYYSPAGNAITWPVGPSLVIKPDEPRAIATSSMCEVTLKENIRDKSGELIPADQRGPFPFRIAPLSIVAIDPTDGSEVDPLAIYYDNFLVQFNTEVDPASWCDEGTGMDECEFEIEGLGSMPNAYYAYNIADALGGGIFTDSGVTEWGLGPNDPLEGGQEYTFRFREGTTLADRCGRETTFGAPSVADHTLVAFETNPFDYTSNVPSNGDIAAPLRKLSVQFNNVIDLASLEPTEYSLTPAPTTPSVVSTPGNDGDLLFAGHYQPGTMYTFTLNAGATINDAHGVTYTQTEARTIAWTTQPITVIGTVPANNGTSTKAMSTSNTTIQIAFNQSMDPATLDPATEVTLVGPTAATFGAATIGLGCLPESTVCRLALTTTAPLADGAYQFTLKMGATVTDVLGNEYTQPTDRVVSFTVATAEPVNPIQCL